MSERWFIVGRIGYGKSWLSKHLGVVNAAILDPKVSDKQLTFEDVNVWFEEVTMYQFPVNPIPSKDQFDSVVPVTRETWQRIIDFQRMHPNVDIRPIINERVNDILDEAERAENG